VGSFFNYCQSNFPSWFSKDLIHLVFLKRKAHATFNASRHPNDYCAFSLLRSKYKQISKNCYKKFIDCTELQFFVNPKNFWKFIRKNKSTKDIPKIVHLDGVFSTDNHEVSDFFSK